MSDFRYKAFISYKHNISKKQVQKIEFAIRKYTTSWFKKSEIEFFIDEKDASSFLPLGNEIIKGLKQSEYLIYIATPQAAKESKFVTSELLYWLDILKRKDKLLIILTDGLIEYDKSKGFDLDAVKIDWTRTNAISKSLKNHLIYTRIHRDLTKFTLSDYTIKNKKFRDEIIRIVASLKGLKASQLDDKISDLYLKNIQIRNFVIFILFLLVLTSSMFYMKSNENKKNAIKNLEEAEYQKTLAIENKNEAIKKAKEAKAQTELANYNKDEAVKYAAEATKQKNIALLNLKEVERQKVFTEIEKEKTLIALEITEATNKEKQKIIDALYFYDNEYALAYKDGKFGFINKKGNVKIKYKYTAAKPFNIKTGLAKVEDGRFQKYYIDTTGYEYKIVDNINSLEVVKKYKEIEYRNFEALVLDNSQFENKIPEIVFEYKDLKILILSEFGRININSIKKIGVLNNLTHLDLKKSILYSKLPREIGKLTKLKYLNIPFNRLKSISNEIGKLENLEYLNLKENKLDSIPFEIGKLKNLKYLNLENNNLTYLPQEIGDLKNLEYLNLHGNKLDSIPTKIGKLKNLKYLNLENNNLSSLPSEMGKLNKLNELYLKKNKLKILPKELGLLNKIKKINIYNNKLSEIPKGIVRFCKRTYISENKNDTIIYLDLSNNRLKKIPKDISYLQDLNEIYLTYNNLSSFPLELCSLKNLKKLTIGNNNFDSIPKKINNLLKLQFLDVGSGGAYKKGTNYGTLYIPNEIGDLINLEYLNLDSRTVCLPIEITKLKKLHLLSLNGSKSSKIPKEIGKLDSLHLNLDYSNIELPKSIINLKIDFTKWNDNNMLFQASRHYFESKKYTNSIEIYKIIMEKEKYNIHYVNELSLKRIADCYCKMKDYSKCKEYYKKAFQNYKKDKANISSDDLFYLAYFSLFNNQPKETISASLKVLEQFPSYTSIKNLLAIGYALNNELDKAKLIISGRNNYFHPVMWEFYDINFETLLKELKSADIWNKNLDDLKLFTETLSTTKYKK